MITNSNSGTGDQQGVITSGRNKSFWVSSVEPIQFTRLQNDLTTEIVVVGGGISGLSIAYKLLKSGREVVLVEDGYIGSGETGRTTAHIVNALDDLYSELEKYFGKEKVKLIADSHTAAIDFIENVVNEEKIDCDFIRLDGYLFLHPTDKLKTLEDELLATREAGIPTTLLSEVPGIPFEKGPCLRYPAQAQFHPMKYLRGLADAIIALGGKIYTETRVDEFGKNEVSAGGFTIKAAHVVVATNTPVNDIVKIHTKQHPYRTYVIAATIPKHVLSPSLWWDTGDQDSKWVNMPYNYVRTQSYTDQYDLLICGGQDHKTGQLDAEDITQEERYAALEKWLVQRFPFVQDVVYRWSGQVMEPVDSLAFIGRNPGDDQVYIATGDSGNGMTHGTIAGMLIPDLINNIPNAWENIYDPSRTSLRAAGDFLKEAGNMAVQYADYLKPGDLDSVKDLKVSDGAVVTVGLKKVAVYRDGEGALSAWSAICPHLGCVLQWNPDEKSFDCPCHGSRFTCQGKLVNGPAMTDLKVVEIKDK
jgi:glycine/D-amino acid oxidase-like deaminating enzyme/nitrite reductase/ring-hydroxylating ferredoxin subunit